MPYKIAWLEKPYVFMLTLSGVITDDEFHELADKVIELLSEIDTPDAITLLDVTDLEKMPSLVVLRREFGRVPEYFDGQELGLSVVYGVSTLMRYIFELLMKFTDMRFKIFDSREKAEMFVWQLIEIEMGKSDEDA